MFCTYCSLILGLSSLWVRPWLAWAWGGGNLANIRASNIAGLSYLRRLAIPEWSWMHNPHSTWQQSCVKIIIFNGNVFHHIKISSTSNGHMWGRDVPGEPRMSSEWSWMHLGHHTRKYFLTQNQHARSHSFSSCRLVPSLVLDTVTNNELILYMSTLIHIENRPKIIIAKINLPPQRTSQIKIEKSCLGPKLLGSKLARRRHSLKINLKPLNKPKWGFQNKPAWGVQNKPTGGFKIHQAGGFKINQAGGLK